jgi:hypothetical protein
MTTEPEYQFRFHFAIPHWILWCFVAVIGFILGAVVERFVVTADEDAAYEHGRRVGYAEGQESHCGKSRVMRAADWLYGPKEAP